MTAGMPSGATHSREGLPKPCLRCGAPMVATETSSLHTDATLTCSFCGSRESMPLDAAAQDRFLRLRLLQVRRAREGLEAPLRTFEMVRQSWAMGLVVFVLVGGWQLWQAFSTAGKVPLQSTLFGILGGSGVVGVVVGYFGMSRAFRSLVKPLLTARAPLQQGLEARCRSCGGELPPLRKSQVQCGFCGANNFLDAAMAHDFTARLAAEQSEYQRQANSGNASNASAYEQPARAFYRWAAIGAGAAALLGVVLVFVLVA